MTRRTRNTPKARTKTRNRRTAPAKAPRATMVVLVTEARGRNRTVSVRTVNTRRALFVCSATDARGAELAVLTAERYCAERGLVLVMAANDTARATAAA